MGRDVFTDYSFKTAASAKGIEFERRSDGSRRAKSNVTYEAEQSSRDSGKLDPAVDPAVMTIRRSLPRFEETPDGKYRLTVGCPMDVESTCDTTGSMGSNVQTMIEVLPETYGMISKVLPGYDPQLALGIFGDKCDRFVMNRPQFEMTAEKIVNYVTKLVPESAGGDGPEDPQYAIFGAAYLTNTYVNRLGLKGYHFCISDASFHDDLDPNILERVYGKHVWQDLADNGFGEITRRNLPDFDDMFKALHARAHAFFIGIECTPSKWLHYYDSAHIIQIESTRYLPQIEAAIIGLTEGAIEPMDVRQWLKDNQVNDYNINLAMRGLKNVKFAAQRDLEKASGLKIPQKGDIFASKQDLQPISHSDDAAVDSTRDESTNTWL